MPIYEYQCSFCNHRLESLQKMADEPLTECPHCKKSGLQRLISATQFQLKGSGWYVTDYSQKGKAAGNEKLHAEGRGAKASTDSKEGKAIEEKSTPSPKDQATSDKKTGGTGDDGKA